MIGSLAGATIVTPDLDIAIAAYGDFLGYRGDPPTLVGAERAAAWRAPRSAGARMTMLYPASGEARFIRLVEGEPAVGFRPLESLGWTAIEIVVQDLDTLAARLNGSPFSTIGAPAVLDFDFTDRISAMQVSGPGGEILYLTRIDGAVPGFDLPTAHSDVGQLFIMVLATAGIADAAAYYACHGRLAGPDIEARIDIVSKAYGLPVEQRHRLTTIALGDRSFIEVDAFPVGVKDRPASTIGLPSGIAMVSMHGDGSSSGLGIGHAGEWIEFLS